MRERRQGKGQFEDNLSHRQRRAFIIIWTPDAAEDGRTPQPRSSFRDQLPRQTDIPSATPRGPTNPEKQCSILQHTSPNGSSLLAQQT